MIWVLAAAIGTIAGAGCEKTGLREGTGTGTGGLETQYTYTPEGCDYEVSTPEVVEAGPSVESGSDGGDGSTLDHVHVSFAGPADTTLAVNWRSEVDNRTSDVLLGTSK
ncbi:MAG: fibronectin type III domain-containing protein, partial [Myxococcales bacterium]|nr:fibronectin type III domain-containing protein [Myxococcales bacterium]